MEMVFVEHKCKDAAFFFSAEEVLVRRHCFEEPVLMLWQTEKTVMLGSNQVVEAEVDLEAARDLGIQIVRRSSGGGAIFTDMGTVLYTVIEPINDDIIARRESAAADVIRALRKMGVPAVREGKNDILADGKKISGLAQHSSGSHVCTHGSLLYNTDLEMLIKVLIANPSKLLPKGIASIRSRVTNMKPYFDESHSVGEFISALKEDLLHGKEYTSYGFTNRDIDDIMQIHRDKYTNNEWNFRL